MHTYRCISTFVQTLTQYVYVYVVHPVAICVYTHISCLFLGMCVRASEYAEYLSWCSAEKKINALIKLVMLILLLVLTPSATGAKTPVGKCGNCVRKQRRAPGIHSATARSPRRHRGRDTRRVSCRSICDRSSAVGPGGQGGGELLRSPRVGSLHPGESSHGALSGGVLSRGS